MDVTNDYKLTWIKRNSNKNNWRVRSFKKDIDLEISQYRLFAYKKRGTVVGSWCAKEANQLEKDLTFAMKSLDSR